MPWWGGLFKSPPPTLFESMFPVVRHRLRVPVGISVKSETCARRSSLLIGERELLRLCERPAASSIGRVAVDIG